MAESDPENSVRYSFAHVAIPVLALWNKKEFYRNAFSKTGTTYLKSIWDGLEQKMGVKESSEGLDSKVFNLKNDMELLVLELPKPREIPEAFFIGIAVAVSKNFFMGKSVEEVRCFTLELGVDVETESTAFFVCEWKSPQPKPDRNTFGSLTSPDPELFVQAIDYLVSDRTCLSLNAQGEAAGAVTKDDDGRSTIATGPKSDLTAMLFSSAIVFSNNLVPNDSCYSHVGPICTVNGRRKTENTSLWRCCTIFMKPRLRENLSQSRFEKSFRCFQRITFLVSLNG